MSARPEIRSLYWHFGGSNIPPIPQLPLKRTPFGELGQVHKEKHVGLRDPYSGIMTHGFLLESLTARQIINDEKQLPFGLYLLVGRNGAVFGLRYSRTYRSIQLATKTQEGEIVELGFVRGNFSVKKHDPLRFALTDGREIDTHTTIGAIVRNTRHIVYVNETYGLLEVDNVKELAEEV